MILKTILYFTPKNINIRPWNFWSAPKLANFLGHSVWL